MTKRILVIGCSHSKNYHDAAIPHIRWSWPEIMQQRLHDRGYDTCTTNTAQYSNSIYGEFHNLKHCLENQTWDLVILQFTTTQRHTYVKDQKLYEKRLRNMTPGFNDVPNYFDWPHRTSVSDYKTFQMNEDGFLHLNGSTAILSNKTSDYKRAYLTNCLYSLSESSPLVTDIHLLIEKEMIRLAREQYGIPTIAYRQDHHDYWNVEYMNNHLDFCVELDLTDYKELLAISSDNYHLGFTGNQQLVRELIMPRVLEAINE